MRIAKKSYKIKYLTKEELGVFLEAVRRTGSIRDRVMFGFMYAYGLRLSECLQLRLSDLNKDYSEVHVRRLKGGIDRHYYIEPKTARLLKRYLKERGIWKNAKKNPYLFTSAQSMHGMMSPQAVQKRMKGFCKTAGTPEDKCHPHALRHSIGIHMYQDGEGIQFIADYLGHTNLKTTRIYQVLSPQDWFKRQKDVVDRLPEF